MKPRKRGRPAFAEGEALDRVFTLRLTENERATLQEAADQTEQPVTKWARKQLLAAAKKTLATRDRGRARKSGKKVAQNKRR